MMDREFILPPNADSDGLPDTGRALRVAVRADGVDLSLLDDSLAKSPWERMLANDDALNFGELLRAAMEQRHARP